MAMSENLAVIENSHAERGMMVVLLAAILTAFFAFATFSLDAALYLKKRNELQALAESVAMAAGQVLPYKGAATSATSGTGAIGEALKWYEVLRTNPDGGQIAPAASACAAKSVDATGTYINCGAIEIKFMDNQNSVSATEPYRTYGLNITVNDTYTPEIFPIRDQTVANITVAGKVVVQPAATDVMLIVENSASFIDNDDSTVTDAANFTSAFGASLARKYEQQCFSEPWRAFKAGVIQLYDRLSALETFRVGVMLMHSRSGLSPVLLSNLGTHSITGYDLDSIDDWSSYKDVPHYPSTRCMEMTRASGANYLVPTNINSGDWTTARTDLTSLFLNGNQSSGDYSVDVTQTFLVREALWFLPGGYWIQNGITGTFPAIMSNTPQIPPRFLYQSPTSAMITAGYILENSRRTDNLPVQHRYIIVLTDDAGYVPIDVTNPYNPGASNYATTPCSSWQNNALFATYRAQIRLGLVFFGHSSTLIGHDYTNNTGSQPISMLQSDCLKPAAANFMGTFFVENSPAYNFDYGNSNKGTTSTSEIYNDFANHLTPTLAHSLIEIEYRKH